MLLVHLIHKCVKQQNHIGLLLSEDACKDIQQHPLFALSEKHGLRNCDASHVRAKPVQQLTLGSNAWKRFCKRNEFVKPILKQVPISIQLVQTPMALKEAGPQYAFVIAANRQVSFKTLSWQSQWHRLKVTQGLWVQYTNSSWRVCSLPCCGQQPWVPSFCWALPKLPKHQVLQHHLIVMLAWPYRPAEWKR